MVFTQGAGARPRSRRTVQLRRLSSPCLLAFVARSFEIEASSQGFLAQPEARFFSRTVHSLDPFQCFQRPTGIRPANRRTTPVSLDCSLWYQCQVSQGYQARSQPLCCPLCLALLPSQPGRQEAHIRWLYLARSCRRRLNRDGREHLRSAVVSQSNTPVHGVIGRYDQSESGSVGERVRLRLRLGFLYLFIGESVTRMQHVSNTRSGSQGWFRYSQLYFRRMRASLGTAGNRWQGKLRKAEFWSKRGAVGRELAPRAGLEPATNGLTVRRSTN